VFLTKAPVDVAKHDLRLAKSSNADAIIAVDV
jgi:hypothetical protein